MITGSTRVAAVIGHPVAHSLSPALHNAAFQAAGVPWVYVAFHVPAGEAARALDAMRTLDLGGLSVDSCALCVFHHLCHQILLDVGAHKRGMYANGSLGIFDEEHCEDRIADGSLLGARLCSRKAQMKENAADCVWERRR